MHIVGSTCAPKPTGVWAIGGPRRLDRSSAQLAEQTARTLLSAGQRLSVGCSTGADACAMAAAVQAQAAERLLIWAACGPVPERCPSETAGAGRWTAAGAVALARRHGAQVHPWAGGRSSVAMQTRLARRVHATAQAATAGVVVLLPARTSSTLTQLLVEEGVRRGLPVLAVPLGCDAGALPGLGVGGWEPAGWCGDVALPGALRWRSARQVLL